MWVRSAGDNDSTAVKATGDQLAARRAFRAKQPRAPRKRAGARAGTPIDPSLGTGLIDNIICEPEDGESHVAEAADDVLDRYSSAAANNAASHNRAADTAAPADRLADDELDEIELQLRLHHTQPLAQSAAVGPRGTAELAPDSSRIRAPRRGEAQRPMRRRMRLGARPAVVASLAVATIVAVAIAVVQPGGSGNRTAVPRPHQSENARAGARATVTPRQLTTAARRRAFVAIERGESGCGASRGT